jgi:hypothetical protein
MEISQQNPSRKHNCGTPPPHQFAIKTQKTGGGQRKKQLTTKKNIEKPNTKKKKLQQQPQQWSKNRTPPLKSIQVQAKSPFPFRASTVFPRLKHPLGGLGLGSGALESPSALAEHLAWRGRVRDGGESMGILSLKGEEANQK